MTRVFKAKFNDAEVWSFKAKHNDHKRAAEEIVKTSDVYHPPEWNGDGGPDSIDADCVPVRVTVWPHKHGTGSMELDGKTFEVFRRSAPVPDSAFKRLPKGMIPGSAVAVTFEAKDCVDG